MSKKSSPDLGFEDALQQLEALVEGMESGELSLEESLASLEKGVALTRICQKSLSEAEQKVKLLTSNTPDAETEAFDVDA